MTMKYDKMIEITQAESQRKMEIAKKAISGMIDSMERITVAELVKRTGLSRGFFYKNELRKFGMIFFLREHVTSFRGSEAVLATTEAI